ncbi:hypothetical protein A33M_1885 [Rhodovulum sp. PH10]|nr:hypothetical protein A33M_1885 [Rhodovulum sp. PH10]
MKSNGRLLGTTVVVLLASGCVAQAAEWPRLPSEPTREATVWDPGPRWPTLPDAATASPARTVVSRSAKPTKPARSKPLPVVQKPATIPARATTSKAIAEERTEVAALPPPIGDFGPQWPRLDSSPAVTGALGEQRPALQKPATTAVASPTAAQAAAQASAWPPASAIRFPKIPMGETTGTVAARWPALPMVPALPPLGPFAVEVGGRYWYSRGSTAFGFANGDPFSGNPTSTLDWNDTTGHSGEVFARIDHRPSGVFVKGFLGGGALDGGTIVDRDFYAGQVKFSDTSSRIGGDDFWYGMIDVGWAYRVPSLGFRVGGFVGYHYWREKMTAYGLRCNADDVGGWFCPTGSVPYPDSTAVGAYEPTWHAMRLGLDAQWRFMPRWTVSGEVAYVPIAHLENADSHLMRADLGPSPNIVSKSSRGYGVEAEVLVSYAVTPNLELGAGGRVWALNTDEGDVKFGPLFATPLELTKFEQVRYGLLVQAKGRF